jgi:hypothetical protein
MTQTFIFLAYHEELGDFFDLTENNAALLKQELREIIGRFAESIVEDLFVNPHQDVMLRTEFGGLSGASIPQGIVVRVGLADNVRECQKLSPLSAEYAFACTNEKPAAEGENSGRGSGAHLTGCSDAEHPERPWIGKWAAQTDNAHFTFDIKKEVVRGRLKSGSKEFPIQGKVDESGVIDAKTLAEVMKVVQ